MAWRTGRRRGSGSRGGGRRVADVGIGGGCGRGGGGVGDRRGSRHMADRRSNRRRVGPRRTAPCRHPGSGASRASRAPSPACASFVSTRTRRSRAARSIPARGESGCSTIGPVEPSRRCWGRRTQASCYSVTTTKRAASPDGQASWLRWHARDRRCIGCSGSSESFPRRPRQFPLISGSTAGGVAPPRRGPPTRRCWKPSRTPRSDTRCSWR